MSKALEIFKASRMQLPSHIADFLKEESNISERNTVPSLSYEGKVWAVSINGQKTKLMKQDENGDQVAMPVMRVVVLDYNKNRGRTYYEGSYDPAKPGTPACWSEDGIKPHAQVSAPPASRCDLCPMSVKGSRVTEQGKGVAACSQHRMIAVVPANNLDAPPLRMKLAMTSDWDERSPELQDKGWFAFKNYTDYLRTLQAGHTAALVTKMQFDPNAAFPKVLFSPDRWLEADELAKVRKMTNTPEVKALLGGFTPNGPEGTRMIAGTATEVKAEAPVAPKPQPKPVVTLDDDDEDLPLVKPKPAIKLMDDDDDEEVVVAKPKKAKVIHKEEAQPVVAAKPAATKSSNPDIDALLEQWGEE
jgi:hypothetical protein